MLTPIAAKTMAKLSSSPPYITEKIIKLEEADRNPLYEETRVLTMQKRI